MVATSLTPFPFRLSPVSDIAPVSYRDSSTFLEELEQLSHWLETVLVPETNGMVDSTRAAWLEYFDDFMANVNAEIVALNENNFQRITSPLTFGAVGDGVVIDVPFIEAAIAGTPEGGTLVFPADKVFNLGSGPVNVTKAITLLGGTFLTNTGKAFNVTVSGAVIDGATITGPGTAVPYVGGNPAIAVQGDVAAYLTDVAVKNTVIAGMRDTGIRLEFVDGFEVYGNTVHNFRYGGIMVNSGRNGSVSRNDIRHAVQDTVGLSYGIAISDLINLVEHRSINVDVTHNYVEDIPEWEGLDTHGGKNISFVSNTVKDCKSGIVFTVGSNTRLTAPEQCRAIDNHVSAKDLILIRNATGIAAGGSGVTHPLHPLKADVLITNNTLSDLSIGVNLPASTGLTVDRTKSLIANNTMISVASPGTVDSRDTGWVPATTYGHFNPGYASNSTYPVMMRVIQGVVKFEGVVSLTADARAGTVFFVLDDPALIPTFDRIMGSGQGSSTPYQQFTLSVNTAGSYRTVFPATIPETNFTVTGEYQL